METTANADRAIDLASCEQPTADCRHHGSRASARRPTSGDAHGGWGFSSLAERGSVTALTLTRRFFFGAKALIIFLGIKLFKRPRASLRSRAQASSTTWPTRAHSRRTAGRNSRRFVFSTRCAGPRGLKSLAPRGHATAWQARASFRGIPDSLFVPGHLLPRSGVARATAAGSLLRKKRREIQ